MSDELFIGIDLGTSGIKVIVSDVNDHLMASASRRVQTHSLHDGWNEQDAHDWWQAVVDCLDELAVQKDIMARVKALSLSGQMLGPVLIDKHDKPIRKVILWNDGRSVDECAELLSIVPDIGLRTNCTPDPGAGAPKLRWLSKHEPQTMDKADCLLLPKDYIRLLLTGERMTEPSDAGGTMLMECATSKWSTELCDAANWNIDKLPAVVWAWEQAGCLRTELSTRFNLPLKLPVAAGAGDNMACSLGVGVAQAGDCALTIGTSGVICSVSDTFKPLPQQAFLTSHHAAPDTFLSMGVVMSATSSFDWIAGITGESPQSLSTKIDQLYNEGKAFHSPVSMPWLNGNRTPHNDPLARGKFSDVNLNTTGAMLGWSILEGVAFQFRECYLKQKEAGIAPDTLSLVGGGSNNVLWSTMIATLLEQTATLPHGRHLAACFGAARLAQVVAGVGKPEQVLHRKPVAEMVIEPDKTMRDSLLERYQRYISLSDS